MRRVLVGGLTLALSISLSSSLGTATQAAQPATDASATAALEAAQAIFSAPGAAGRGHGGSVTGRPDTSASLRLADLVGSYDRLSPSQRKQADGLLARPDGDGPTGAENDAVAWDSSNDTVKCAAHVCLHYLAPGASTHSPPDDSWADLTLAELESVYGFETSALGYRAPAGDGSVGGNAKFDVYLANLGALGLYGYCAPETKVSGQRYRYTSYCVLDNDFSTDEFPLGPIASMQVTAAHEFFHAIQFNYDTFEDRWLMEATATWMEERYADGINDNRQYIRFGQTAKPGVPLDTFGAFTHYGNWTFFEKLSQTYGTASVRALWTRLDGSVGARDQSSIQAIKGYLASKRTTLPAFYARFAAGNLTPAKSYSEGAAYRAAPLKDSFTLKKTRRTVKWSAKLKHLTSQSFNLKSKMSGKHKLKISVNGPTAATGPAVVVSLYKATGGIKRVLVKLNANGDGSKTVGFNRPAITRVVVTLANASSRYTCWQRTNFACQGVPKDNGTRFAVTAQLR